MIRFSLSETKKNNSSTTLAKETFTFMASWFFPLLFLLCAEDYLDIHLIYLLSELFVYIKERDGKREINKLRSSHYLTWRFLTIIHMCGKNLDERCKEWDFSGFLEVKISFYFLEFSSRLFIFYCEAFTHKLFKCDQTIMNVPMTI